jgi:hypothetical protein
MSPLCSPASAGLELREAISFETEPEAREGSEELSAEVLEHPASRDVGKLLRVVAEAWTAGAEVRILRGGAREGFCHAHREVVRTTRQPISPLMTGPTSFSRVSGDLYRRRAPAVFSGTGFVPHRS